MSKPNITVEMLHDHPLIRFSYAFATKRGGQGLEGQINLSIQNLEEAKTLRDALNAFIDARTPTKLEWNSETLERLNWTKTP